MKDMKGIGVIHRKQVPATIAKEKVQNMHSSTTK
jgi:hypothetical protein